MVTLITGGTGMVGSALARRLLADGDEVVIADISSDPYYLDGRHVSLDDVNLEVGNITDASFLSKVLTEYSVDRVVHLAGAVSALCNEDPILATEANCTAAVRLLDACRTQDIARVVMVSTAAVYAPRDQYHASQLPPNEGSLVGFSPSSPLYGVGKLYLEAAARWYSSHYGMEVAGLRPAFIASAGRPSIPPMGVVGAELTDSAAIGRPVTVPDGLMLVPYVYVEDVVDQFRLLLEAPAAKLAAGPFFNTGGPVYTVNELVAEIRLAIPDAEITVERNGEQDSPHGHTPFFPGEKFAETFGFSLRYDLRRGVRAQIEEARAWPGLRNVSAA